MLLTFTLTFATGMAIVFGVALWLDNAADRYRDPEHPWWTGRSWGFVDRRLARYEELAPFTASQRRYLWQRANGEYDRDHPWLRNIQGFVNAFSFLFVTVSLKKFSTSLEHESVSLPFGVILTGEFLYILLVTIMLMTFQLGFAVLFDRFRSKQIRQELDFVIRHERVRPQGAATVASHS